MFKAKKRKWDFKKIIIILLFMFLVMDKSVYASNQFEYDEIQDVIDDIFTDNTKFDFGKLVGDLIRGENDISFSQILIKIKDGILGEIRANIKDLTAVIAIAIIAAIFTNISLAFKNNQVSDTGFYVTYLMLFAVVTTSFIKVSNIAYDSIGRILDFMKVLVPTYIMSLALSTGSATSYIYYQFTLFLITLVDIVLLKLIIPVINIQFIIAIANNLSKEDMLSKLSELLSEGVSWLLKTLMTLVITLNAISGLLTPVADKLKKNGIFKAAKAIPGLGDVIGGVAESVISASVLLKNAIGVAGLVILIIICAVPLLKMGVTSLIYKLSAAVIQPISDKRIINCISVTADACVLLFNTVLVGLVLFVITITIIAMSTT
ncbi:MAG: stage III sporulation protein AF [Clostridiales bacterium]|nr:stage III sporulation protein AF [Clostridiales bacterium]